MNKINKKKSIAWAFVSLIIMATILLATLLLAAFFMFFGNIILEHYNIKQLDFKTSFAILAILINTLMIILLSKEITESN